MLKCSVLMRGIFCSSLLFIITPKHWPHRNEMSGPSTVGNFDWINKFPWNCSMLLNQQIHIRANTKLWPYWNMQSWQLPIGSVDKSIDSCKTFDLADSTTFHWAMSGVGRVSWHLPSPPPHHPTCLSLVRLSPHLLLLWRLAQQSCSPHQMLWRCSWGPSIAGTSSLWFTSESPFIYFWSPSKINLFSRGHVCMHRCVFMWKL